MRKIGFHGGCRICELGPAPDMMLFFDCVKTYVEQDYPEQDWSLLTDRLYRRYLRQEELDQASTLMGQVRQIFAGLPASAIDWDPSMLGNVEKTWLNPNRPTLADLFSKYFEGFENAHSSAQAFLKDFNIYQPVRVVISDLPGFTRDQKKPLAQYDALEGKPFWLQ